MPGYEKTKQYFIRTNLYTYLMENGDLEWMISNLEKRCQLGKEAPKNLKAYLEFRDNNVISLLNNTQKDVLMPNKILTP